MSTKQWCASCKEEVEVEVDEAEGHAFCALCGLQLEDLLFESGPQFVKSGDTAHVAGSLIRDDMLSKAGAGYGGGYGDDSRERSISKGQYWIRNFAYQLQVPETHAYIDQATRVYQLAISTGFTRGRRTNQVAAACLYIVLRQDRRPYMLIDFCHLLSVNVYVLGATYLRLTERLRLDTHPVMVAAVDPSLYLHRFAGRLKLPENMLDTVVQTAMILIAQMKRDWMQTGRRPAGVCGAALWLACHIHGFQKSMRDVIKVVSVGESTILARVNELRGTSASDLTLTEFKERAKGCLAQQQALEDKRTDAAEDERGSGATCRHVSNQTAEPFAHGMCQACYTDYVKSSGGIEAGAEDPPAYTRNLRREVAQMKKTARADALRSIMPSLTATLRASQPAMSALTALLPTDDTEVPALTDAAAGPGGAAAGKPDAEARDPKAGAIVPAPADDKKPSKKKRGRKRKAKPLDPVEVEFALAFLQNDSVRQMAQALNQEGDMELPVADVAEAHALLEQASQADVIADPDVAAAVTAATQTRNDTDKTGDEAGPSNAGAQAASAAAADMGAPMDPSAMMAAAAFYDLQHGRHLQLTRDNEDPEMTDDMRKRAQELSLQAARPPAAASQAAKKPAAVSIGGGGGGLEIAGIVPEPDEEDEDAPQVAEDQIEAVPEEPDNLSDISDEEIDGYLATQEEVEIRKEIWLVQNKDWMEKQSAKEAAQEAAETAEAQVKRKTYKKQAKPFAQGATAEESVLNMLDSKNLKSRVNQDVLHQFFRDAEIMGQGEPANAAGSEQAAAGNNAALDEFLQESAMGQQIKEVQKATQASMSAKKQKSLQALARERTQGAGVLDMLSAPAPKRARLSRLGRLK